MKVSDFLRLCYGLALVVLMTGSVSAQKGYKPVKLKPGMKAPTFQVEDISGKPFDLTKRSKPYIYLVFNRYASCPVCHLRTATLLFNAQKFIDNEVQVVMVYEASPEVLKKYLEKVPVPFVAIPNLNRSLYDLYDTEKSYLKFARSFANGVVGKHNKGKEQVDLPKEEGSWVTMPAEFLIGPKNEVLLAKYASYLGDDQPIKEVFDKLAEVRGKK